MTFHFVLYHAVTFNPVSNFDLGRTRSNAAYLSPTRGAPNLIHALDVRANDPHPEFMAIETTYFVGAGASKAFYPALPLASEMTLEYLLDRRGSPIGSDLAIENVEQYVSDERWPHMKRQIPFEQICLELPILPRENLEICLFRKLRIEGWPGCLHPWLKESLDSSHPILTTNYDTVVEWDAENFHFAPVGNGDSGIIDYGVPDHFCLPLASAGPRLDGKRNKLLLLKLYGSMSWSRCEDCHKYLLERIYDHGAEDAIMGRGKCSGCGGKRRNAVFVPLVGEKIPNDIALKAIWERARQTLSHSREIVFAGFSLNPDDKSIRELLQRADSAGNTCSVTIVLNQSHPEIIERYRGIYGDRVNSYDSGWAQYFQERTARAAGRVGVRG